MKGFLVVDRLNDIHFIDTDKEFARHINEQAREFGLLNVSTVEFNQNPINFVQYSDIRILANTCIYP